MGEAYERVQEWSVGFSSTGAISLILNDRARALRLVEKMREDIRAAKTETT